MNQFLFANLIVIKLLKKKNRQHVATLVSISELGMINTSAWLWHLSVQRYYYHIDSQHGYCYHRGGGGGEEEANLNGL